MNIIIIFGANGYLGINFICKIFNSIDSKIVKPFKIIAIDKNTDKLEKIINSENKEFNDFGKQIKIIKLDLSKKDTVLNLSAQINYEFCDDLYIYDFAAISFVDNSLFEPLKIYKNNVGCSINICDYVQSIYSNNLKAFVRISTDEVSNRNVKKIYRSPYSVSKEIGDNYCIEHLKNKAYVILRPCKFYSLETTEGKINKDLISQSMSDNCLVNKIIKHLKGEKVNFYKPIDETIRRFINIKLMCDILYKLCFNNHVMGVYDILTNSKKLFRSNDEYEQNVFYTCYNNECYISDLMRHYGININSEEMNYNIREYYNDSRYNYETERIENEKYENITEFIDNYK